MSNPIKRIFDLYISDLNYQEIEKLIKKESSEVYDFFAKDISKPDSSKNKFIRILIFARNLFNAFLLKLSPARRIFYLIAVFFIFIGFFQNFDSYIISGIIIINLLLAFELVDKLLMKDELSLAKKIQEKLISPEKSNSANFEFATYYESAKEISGDYLDIIKSNNKSNIIIGDISGKGISAALYMVRVQAILQILYDFYDSAKDILFKLNENFIKKLKPGSFLTLGIVEIDSENNLKFFNAGHLPFIYYSSKKNNVEEINPKGIGIGLAKDRIFNDSIEHHQLKAEKEDILVLFTDGLTESMNRFNEFFDTERIKKVILKYYSESPEKIKDEIIKNFNNFKSNNFVKDDITLIVVKFH